MPKAILEVIGLAVLLVFVIYFEKLGVQKDIIISNLAFYFVIAYRTIPSYNKILEFFRLSPSGICGSDAIRQVLMHYGNYCEDQMKAGRLASSQDLLEAENAVLNMFESTKGRPEEPE